MAIRAAVGADRSRLLRQLLTENVLLSLMGGVTGLGVALLGVASIRQFGPANIPRLNEIGIDGRVLAFTFFVALTTGLIFGLGPALRASRVDPNSALKEGGRGSVGTSAFGLGHGQLRKILITAEVALSLVLLIGAGLLIRSYARISNANPGFNPHNVLSLRVSLPGFRYKTPELVSGFLPTARRAHTRAAGRGIRRHQLSAAVELRRAGVGTDRHRGLRPQGGGQRSHHREQRVHQLRLSPRDGRAAAQGPLFHGAGQQAIT